MGKAKSQRMARPQAKAPTNRIFMTVSAALPFCCKCLPKAYPAITLAKAGKVLKRPSGSKAMPSPWYRCASPNRAKSMCNPAFPVMEKGSPGRPNARRIPQ